jgi:flagellar hook-associated protein 3 FlgL
MNRISTGSNYSAVLANLMAAQQRQVEAGAQVASQKNGDDLKGFAKNAEILTAMRSVQTRTEAYLDQNILVADRLTTQTTALGQIGEAALAVRQAMAEAIATGRVDTLVEDVEAQFRNAAEGLNARHGGKYLFAGGQIDTRPMTATALSDLTAPATVIADFFENDDYISQAKLDDSTIVDTGMLADDIGAAMMQAFKDFQTFQEGVDGPFTGELTDAQRTFLEGQLAVWDQQQADLTHMRGRNGLIEKRTETVKDDLVRRNDSLKGMVGGIVDVDMAQAAVNLQAAGIAVQAAAQVFNSLTQSSLLNYLK